MGTSTASATARMTLQDFLANFGSTKRAEALSEPGSQGGETSHPVKNVDDRLQPAEEGARSAENTKDVKAVVGAAAVDSASDAKKTAALRKRAEGRVVNPEGTAAEDQIQIGTTKKPTGEDSENGTASAGAGKDDPGSAHPARTDNDELDGHKYAYDQTTTIDDFVKMAADLGNRICANIASNPYGIKQAIDTGLSGQIAREAGQVNKSAGVDIAAQAGWQLADLLTGDMDKQAADAMIFDTTYSIVKQASDAADLTAAHLYYLAKQAEGEGMPPEGMPPEGMPPEGMPPEAGGGAPLSEEEMLASLGAGDDAGGGAPSEGEVDAETEQLLQALSEAGVTPEELEAAIANESGGGGGAPEGAMPPEAMGGAAPPPGMEVQAADKLAATKAAAQYFLELASRSRKR